MTECNELHSLVDSPGVGWHNERGLGEFVWRALALSRDLSLSSAYDAQYQALSEVMRVPLFPAGRKLAQKVGKRLPPLRLVAGE